MLKTSWKQWISSVPVEVARSGKRVLRAGGGRLRALHPAHRAMLKQLPEPLPIVPVTLADVPDLVSWQRQYRLQNGTRLVQLDPLTIETPAASWSYAFEVPLAESGIPISPPPTLSVVVQVLRGVIGIG